MLQSLTFPDGHTAVQYGYDANGNLVSVTRPPNNRPANGTPVNPVQTYGYQALGSDYVLQFAASPRWNSGCASAAGCYSDGGGYLIGYGGSSAATSTVASIQDGAIVNPVVPDGSGSNAIQGAAYPANVYIYRTEYYTIANWNDYVLNGRWQSTYRDTAGHMSNWIVDGNGRSTQTQVCTASTGQGTQCPSSSWLVASQTWDASNNLTAVVDPRGAETDLAYDINGNVVAVAQPAQYNGLARPTTLIDYDNYSNVVAVCDPALVHSTGVDWSGAGQYSGGSDAYCSTAFPSGHVIMQYSSMTQSAVPQTAYEPYGELAVLKSAGGYKTQISYDLAPQGGTDYGLPTKMTGDLITQLDGSQRQRITSLTYDAHGNLLCRQTNAGGGTTATVVMTYDSLNRVTAAADPDDASLTGACTGKMAGIPGSAIVTRATYYADESLESIQTPSEAAANGGTTFTYDLDGDLVSQAPYTSTPQNTQTPATVKNWFDGMDRMVETQQPADPHTTGDIPISQRFLYDLSQGGSAATSGGATVTAYGNMFDIEKNTPTTWTDVTYSSFDSADRVTNNYAFAPCPAQQGGPSGAIYCSQSAYGTRYDWDSSPSLNPSFSAPGLLIATLDGTGASRKYTFDGIGEMDTINYAGDNGVTTPVGYSYDFDGRLTNASASYPSGTSPQNPWWGYSYNADGLLSQAGGSSLGYGISYSYYPDSLISTVSATQTKTTYGDIINQPSLQTYEYRSDGALTKETFGAASQTVSWAYTSGGRMTSQTDFNGSPSITAQYLDGHGRLSSYTTPSGAYGSFQYDAEGRILQYTDPYAAVDGETATSAYNIRGDLIGRTFSGGSPASKPGFQYKNIQGVLVQNPTDQYDGRTGAPLILGDASGTAVFTYDSVGRMRAGNGSVLSYDAENRLVSGDTFGASSAGDANCQSGGAVAPGFPPWS